MMVITKCLIVCWLLIVTAQAHANNTWTSATQTDQLNDEGTATNRTGRIMKILRDPQSTVSSGSLKRIRSSQNAQGRRERFPPSPGVPQQHQYPSAHVPHRSLPNLLGSRPQTLRRVHSGPPANVLMHHPPQSPVSSIPQQLLAYGKGSITFGKGSSYRPQFTAGVHPNSLRPQQGMQQYVPHSPNSFINFKPSAQYSGTPILRPANAYPQYTKLFKQYMHNPDIRQHPLPQQHPQLQLLQQQQKQQPQYFSQRPKESTAEQNFQAAQHPVPSSSFFSPSSLAGQSTYSVYEESEFDDDRPSTTEAPDVAAMEAEEYIKFMSTNEYFLPKTNPNYKQIDEAGIIRQYRQQPQTQQSIQHSKTVKPANSVGSDGNFKRPHQMTKQFYQPSAPSSASASSTAVRGSYQAGKNTFVVRSDGNKGTKHIVTNSLATPQTTQAPSYKQHSTYQRPHKPQTPGPMHFEFTENDAILAVQSQTKSPPSFHYKGNVIHAPNGVYIQHSADKNLSATSFVYQKHPNSVNDVDSDPEDGDDMHDTGIGTFGRVPIRNPLQKMSVDNVSESSSTPATEQKDTEEFCERMCSNVQDDEEIVCGSDGFMYTGEAQMECYASCLHIEVSIQGKGTCSVR